MKRLLLFIFCGGGLALAQEPAPSPSSPSAEQDLRPRLYDVAGAIGNEGFKLRDGFWSGVLQGSKTHRLAVNLFAGNQYWFCAASSSPAETPSLSLRNTEGKAVEAETFERNGIFAVGVTPPATGRYVLDLKGTERGSRDFCVLYLFK